MPPHSRQPETFRATQAQATSSVQGPVAHTVSRTQGCVRGPAAMPSSKMGVAHATIMAHIERQHCGSGDVELDDVEDLVAYLARVYQPYPLAMYQKLRDVRDRLKHLDPLWRLHPKDPVSVVPSQRGPSATIDFWVAVWHLGFTSESCIKGKSKAIRILECVEDFLSVPYSTLRSPLQVLGPWGPPQAHIDLFSVRHRVGFGRSLSCQLLLWLYQT